MPTPLPTPVSTPVCAAAPTPGTGLQAAATTYSQLAGILAGFALAALIALLTARLGARNSSSHLAATYRPVVAAFVGLVAASLAFALVAGEDIGVGRASMLETAAGMGLSSAVLTLLYALLVLLHAVERDVPDDTGRSRRAFTLLQNAFVLIMSPLAVLVFAAGMRDHIRLRSGTTTGLQALDVATFAAVGLVLAAGVLARVAGRHRERGPRSAQIEELLPAFSLVVAAGAVLVGVGVVVWAEPCGVGPDLLPPLELGLMTAYSVTAAYVGAGLHRTPGPVTT